MPALSPLTAGSLPASCSPPMMSLPGTTHWRPPPIPSTTYPLCRPPRVPGMGTYPEAVLGAQGVTGAGEGGRRGQVAHAPVLVLILQVTQLCGELCISCAVSQMLMVHGGTGVPSEQLCESGSTDTWRPPAGALEGPWVPTYIVPTWPLQEPPCTSSGLTGWLLSWSGSPALSLAPTL